MEDNRNMPRRNGIPDREMIMEMNWRNGTGKDGKDGYSPFDFNLPPQEEFDSEEMIGTMQRALARNIGQFVVVEFLIGTEQIMRKQGILAHVGRTYVTLYDDMQNNFIVCDIFSIKFVYFYYPDDRPRRNYNILPGTNGTGSAR